MEKNGKYYMEKYEKIVESKTAIFDKEGNKLEIRKHGEFKQCYDVNEAVRKDLKPYWFVSKSGELISVYRKNPLWVKKCVDNNGRASYCYNLNGRKKKIQAPVLAGLVWDAYRFGKAAEKLEEKSVYAFGNASDSLNLNLHHTLSREQYPDICNTDESENEIVTVQVHKVMEQTKRALNNEEEIKTMKRFSEVANEECPDEVVVLETDERYNKQMKLHIMELRKSMFWKMIKVLNLQIEEWKI